VAKIYADFSPRLLQTFSNAPSHRGCCVSVSQIMASGSAAGTIASWSDKYWPLLFIANSPPAVNFMFDGWLNCRREASNEHSDVEFSSQCRRVSK